jgi:uncharacterized membrane protein YfhO
MKKIAENEFYQESSLIPGFKSELYLYELDRYGSIITIPSKVQTIEFNSVDINDLNQVKNIFDRNIATIEIKGGPVGNPEIISQTAIENLISNIVFGKDKVKFSVDFKEQNYVVLNMSYYPGWRAFVDGKEQAVGRANINSMAILVPDGRHKVELLFDIKKMIAGTLSL